MTSDAFAGLPDALAAALERRGFDALTAVQQAVVSAQAKGRDLRISSQTGSGKTVAIGFALADHFLETLAAPPVDRDSTTGPVAPSGEPPRAPRGPRVSGGTPDGIAHPSALLIVPTRELAAQVRNELAWLYADLRGLRVEVVTGGTSILNERRALARGPQLVVGTPGRLLDHLRNGAIATDAIAHVVLDEADQMLDMGFREELDAILETLPPERASHLVSATFPRGVLDLAKRFQREPLVLEGTRLGAANVDIQHIGYAIRRHETYAALVNVLLMAEGERCLLFVNRRVDASELAEKLAADGFGAAPFSGELPQAQRTRTLAAFRHGTLPILVSTEVAARGIDIPDITTVIHVDPPREADAYTHRSGRTGRAGRTGRSVLLVTPGDLARVERMLRYAKVELSWQPVPTPEKVEKALRKRARRELHERLTDHTPEESQWLYAKSLLEGRDPIQVVATLLDLARAQSACTPLPVEGFDPTRPRSRREGRQNEPFSRRRDGSSRAPRGDRRYGGPSRAPHGERRNDGPPHAPHSARRNDGPPHAPHSARRNDGPPAGPRGERRHDGPHRAPQSARRNGGPSGGPRGERRDDGPHRAARGERRHDGPARGPRGEGRYDRSPRGPRGEGRYDGSPRGPRGEGRYDGSPRGPRGEGRYDGSPRRPRGERGDDRAFGAQREDRGRRPGGSRGPRGAERADDRPPSGPQRDAAPRTRVFRGPRQGGPGGAPGGPGGRGRPPSKGRPGGKRG